LAPSNFVAVYKRWCHTTYIRCSSSGVMVHTTQTISA